ncbi:MAG: type IV secretory system conjugative DNA transfer family protein, partial [[Clostridium] leptum]
FLYLGGNEKETHKYVSELMGRETLDTNTYGRSRGRSGSFSVNDQQTGRELLTPDEVRLLDNRRAILFVRGERPIMDDKYDLMRHPNIRLAEDGGAPPYDYTQAKDAADDLDYSPEQYDDFELLDPEDFLEEKPRKKLPY